MNLTSIYSLIEEFCSETHGSSDYGKEDIYVKGESNDQFAPLKFLKKKNETLNDIDDLLSLGFVYSSHDFVENSDFRSWYEKQFSKKLSIKRAKEAHVIYKPDVAKVFGILEQMNQSYEQLKAENVLLNGKSFPIQVGEWLAKSIFGLKQVKSSSQRGFDFIMDGKRVEVKVHWKEKSSPKGVKVRKSLVNLSDSCLLIYLNTNFLIRDICYLDSDFVKRKFSGKGHTLFLKDSDVNAYFFSKSDKHFSKIADKSAMMKFAAPMFAMKLDGRL